MTEQRVRELLNAGLSPASAAAIAASEAIQEAAIEEGGPGGSSFPLTADVSADGHTISDLADPVDDGDAVPKSYVDGLAGGAVLVATTALTSAQILDLFDTPVELVPAPGVGKVLAPVLIVASITTGTPYATNVDLAVRLGNADSFVLFSAFLEADPSQVEMHGLDSLTSLISEAENEAMLVTVVGGNPETGDSTMRITVLYAVVDLA